MKKRLNWWKELSSTLPFHFKSLFSNVLLNFISTCHLVLISFPYFSSHLFGMIGTVWLLCLIEHSVTIWYSTLSFLAWLSSYSSEIKDYFEQFPFCISSPGALKLDILARSSSQLEFQFSILFFTIRTAVLIFLFSV